MTDKLDFNDITENPDTYCEPASKLIKAILLAFNEEIKNSSYEVNVNGLICFIISTFSLSLSRITSALIEEDEVEYFLSAFSLAFQKSFKISKKQHDAFLNEQ